MRESYHRVSRRLDYNGFVSDSATTAQAPVHDNQHYRGQYLAYGRLLHCFLPCSPITMRWIGGTSAFKFVVEGKCEPSSSGDHDDLCLVVSQDSKSFDLQVNGLCFHRLIMPEWAEGVLQNPLSSSHQESYSPVELCSAGKLACASQLSSLWLVLTASLGIDAHTRHAQLPPPQQPPTISSIGPSHLFAIHSFYGPRPGHFPDTNQSSPVELQAVCVFGPNLRVSISLRRRLSAFSMQQTVTATFLDTFTFQPSCNTPIVLVHVCVRFR